MSFIKKYLKRYFVDAMSYMALGLFSSLIVGLIISQLSKIPGLGILATFSGVLAASSPVVGGAIGAAIAYGLKSKPLVVFSCIAVGAFGYELGGPVGAYVSALVANEVARIVSGRTKIDIVITPLVTIITGGFVSSFAGPYLSDFMTGLGDLINAATQLGGLSSKCNTFIKENFSRSFPAETFSRSVVKKINNNEYVDMNKVEAIGKSCKTPCDIPTLALQKRIK